MGEVLLKPYFDIVDGKSDLERRNAIISAQGDAKDAQQRILGYVMCESSPELRSLDPRSVRTWMRGRDIIVDGCALLPLMANALEHRDFVSVFWSVLRPGLVNVCQSFVTLFQAYLDFCDVCGRKSRLSRRNFIGMLADIVRKEWVCPTDADGSLSRVNPYQWVLGRESYIEILVARCGERFGDGPMTVESLSRWLPPFGDRRVISKGGALYLRSVYEWCHANHTTPRQAIESRWGVDVEEPNLDETKPWNRTAAMEEYWMDYQMALSASQPKLVRLAKRERPRE